MSCFKVLYFCKLLIKKFSFFLILLFLSFLALNLTPVSYAQDQPTPTPAKLHSIYNLPASAKELIVCSPNTAIANRDERNSCPRELVDQVYPKIGETCASNYQDFLSDPVKKHFWVEDPQITAQGKANERARQFLYWTLNTGVIDSAPVLNEVWRFSSGIALFGVVIVAAIFGIGYIVSQRTNYDFKIRIFPTLTKIGLMLLYVLMSSAIVFTLIQLSEIISRFSLDNLGGNQLFNIYFSRDSSAGLLGSTEKNYLEYFGCRDLNIRVQEGVETQLFMLKLTNVTYYVMGIMLLLRKILLWFLLFVSPFLALLMPFIFIRNTGWIWIGVFFQWLFYGPLLALFLGGMAKIWEKGIPWAFDFSRINSKEGYVYPTGIFLLYGGPAQRDGLLGENKINALNNASYVDTFAEYLISLLMLWAVTFFPWWLLRIFRDYCCDGIYASKNILMAIYDNMRSPKPSGPKPPMTPTKGPTLAQNTPVITEVKTLKTIDITKSLNLKATKLTDIAKFETNKTSVSESVKNLKLIANPVQAEKPAERQVFMNLRSELFSRAIKNDTKAQVILQATSNSVSEKTKIRETILKSLPQKVSIMQFLSSESSISQDKLSNITNNFNKSILNNQRAISSIATSASTNTQNVHNIMQSYVKNISRPISNVLNTIASETNNTVVTVKNVLNKARTFSTQAQITGSLTANQKIKTDTITRLISEIRASTASTISKDEVKVSSIKEVVTRDEYVSTISQKTNTSNETVRSVLNFAPAGTTSVNTQQTQEIANKAQTTTQNVVNILNEARSIVSETAKAPSAIASAPISEIQENIKDQSQKTEEKTTVSTGEVSKLTTQEVKTVKSLMTVTAQNEQVVSTLATETKLNPQQVRSVITSYASHVGESPAEVVKNVEKASGVAKEDVQTVIENIADTVLDSEEIVSDVALKENISKEQVSQVMGKQLEVATAPQENIEKTIAIPQTISIEDYEEVKEMWSKQYEEGEVPVSESIKTRADWIQQEVVILTNTLNKIMSEDVKLQQQGLDDVGFLLPIFLINSLKGEELIVYLKAKLEAAKATEKIIARESMLREKIKKEQEEEDTQVFVESDKKEEEKVMHMDFDDDKPKLKGIDERVRAVTDKLNEFNGN